jgi:hypothetical protein
MAVEAAPKSAEFKDAWDVATRLRKDLNINGYTGWRLPTDKELNLMYTNLKQKRLGDFRNDRYWSSFQFGGFAQHQDFHFGGQDSGFKVFSHYVRPIRAFSYSDLEQG